MKNVLLALLFLVGCVEAAYSAGTQWQPDNSNFTFTVVYDEDWFYIKLDSENFTIKENESTSELTFRFTNGEGEINISNMTQPLTLINSTATSPGEILYEYFGLYNNSYVVLNASRGLVAGNITGPDINWSKTEGQEEFLIVTKALPQQNYLAGGGPDDLLLVLIIIGIIIMFG